MVHKKTQQRTFKLETMNAAPGIHDQETPMDIVIVSEHYGEVETLEEFDPDLGGMWKTCFEYKCHVHRQTGTF